MFNPEAPLTPQTASQLRAETNAVLEDPANISAVEDFWRVDIAPAIQRSVSQGYFFITIEDVPSGIRGNVEPLKTFLRRGGFKITEDKDGLTVAWD